MLSRLSRPAALSSALLLSLAVLTACGDDSSAGETAEGFDAVEVSGEVGQVPEIDWTAMLEPGEAQSEVVEEGDGPELAEGDQVLINFAVSDDYSQGVVAETYGEDQAGAMLTVGGEVQPQQALDLLTALVAEQVEPGTTLGTRIAVTADAKEEWGDTATALAELDIGNEDGLVIVADLVSVPLAGPDGAAKPAPGWAPKIVQTKGEPTNLDSTGLPEPDAKAKSIRKVTLIQGTGPAVKKGDLAVVKYLGQVYGGDEPFDGDLSAKDSFAVNVGSGVTGGGSSVIPGWSKGLEGVPVGSRVLLQIPPNLGYGEQGQGETIPPNSTLYFVVDVLAAA